MVNNITVGICAYNEGKSIGRAVSSILPELNKTDELIVVASACTDYTVDVVKKYARKDKRIKLIEESARSGKGSAQNVIMKKARNELVVFTDADLIIKQGSIKKLLPHFNDSSIGAVMGRTVPYLCDNFFANLQKFGWDVLHERRSKESEAGSLFALNGYLFAVRKKAFVSIDKSNTVEDALLGWNIKNKGYSIVYEPDAKVLVNPAHTLNDYIVEKKRVRYGWWQMTKAGMNIKRQRSVSDLRYLFTSIYAWPYLFLDLYIWVSAYLDLKQNKNLKDEWKKISSSKI